MQPCAVSLMHEQHDLLGNSGMLPCQAYSRTKRVLTDVQVYVLSVPSVSASGSKMPEHDHYFVRDLVVRLQIGQINEDGSPLNRCALATARPAQPLPAVWCTYRALHQPKSRDPQPQR